MLLQFTKCFSTVSKRKLIPPTPSPTVLAVAFGFLSEEEGKTKAKRKQTNSEKTTSFSNMPQFGNRNHLVKRDQNLLLSLYIPFKSIWTYTEASVGMLPTPT